MSAERVLCPLNPEMDRERQNAEVIARISNLKPPQNIILVTHQLNIAAITGENLAEGDAVVVGYDRARKKLVVAGQLQFR